MDAVPKEHVYEYMNNLDYSSIKQLCTVNKYLYNLSKTEMFKRLIAKKYYLLIRDRMQNRFNTKKDRYIRDIISCLNSVPGKRCGYAKSSHGPGSIIDDESILVTNREPGVFDLSEKFSSHQSSLLFKMFDAETNFSSTTFEELLAYAQAYDNEDNDNYLVNKLYQYGAKSILPYWNKRGKYSFWHDTQIELKNSSYDKVYRVFELLIANGWKMNYAQ